MSTIFFEGAPVEWVGGGFQATGHIVALGNTHAHVKWASGPDANQITFIDLYDVEPITASKKTDDDPMHLVAVRRAYDRGQETGVLNFLASNDYLDTWKEIAKDALEYVESRIRTDASMDLVEEQLTIPEREQVIKAGALALLKDAFSDIVEE